MGVIGCPTGIQKTKQATSLVKLEQNMWLVYSCISCLVLLTALGDKEKICFHRFCLPPDYDKEVEPTENSTVIISPAVSEVYEVRGEFICHV